MKSKGRREALDRLHTLTVEAQSEFRFETVERTIDAVVQTTGRARTG
jgi:hypothetical protein